MECLANGAVSRARRTWELGHGIDCPWKASNFGTLRILISQISAARHYTYRDEGTLFGNYQFYFSPSSRGLLLDNPAPETSIEP